jgi:Rab-GTPase-TBC domain
MKNQKVIKNDCDRTRVREKNLVNSFREYLECFLTFYCKKVEIKYKQGLNEIMAPFILLKSKTSIGLSRIFNLAMFFIRKFLTNYYHEDEFFSLQSSLALLNILLKYHNTVIYNIFEFALITPEMYATSWILTIFAK